MKIAFILSQVVPSGPFIVAKDLIEVMILQGHQIDIFYLHGEIRQSYPVAPKRIKYWSLVDFSCYDIVHSHGFRADVYVHFHQQRIAKTSKAKTLSTLHQYNSIQIPFDYSQKWKMLLVEALWKRSLQSKDHIAALTKHMASYYQKYLGISRISVVHNGRSLPAIMDPCDPQLLSQIQTAKKKYRVIGAAGLLTPRKGFDQIIRLLAQQENLFAVILGDGDERQNLLDQASSLGVSDRLLLCGFRPNPTAYYPHFDVFVFPSHAEGFSLVITEAAACGIPVVCSKLPFLEESYSEDEIPRFEVNDLAGLKRALDQILRDPEMYAQRAHAKYSKHFTREAMVERYLSLYAKIKGN